MPTSQRLFGALTTLTITLTGLANAAGRVSNQIVFADGSTTFKSPYAAQVHFHTKVGTGTPTAGNTIQFYWVPASSGSMGSHISGNLATTDTGYTSGSSPFTAAQLRDQLRFVYSQPMIATSALDYYGSFIIPDPGPRGSLYVYNDSGVSLDTTAANFYVRYETLNVDLS
jgi:hypothetical protein